MISKAARWLFEDVWGWRVEGPISSLPKYLIVVAPHTSNWDFLIGLLFRRFTNGFNPKYVAKKELFVWPLGYLFKALGGFPVERSKNNNFVDALVNVYTTESEFVTTITPEGTRSYTDTWKTGFYHVAKNANVPIVRVAFDYKTKRVIFCEPYTITKGVDETVSKFKQYFSQYTGKNAKNGVKWRE